MSIALKQGSIEALVFLRYLYDRFIVSDISNIIIFIKAGWEDDDVTYIIFLVKYYSVTFLRNIVSKLSKMKV